MLVELLGVGEIGDRGEHFPILQVMALHDIVLVREIGSIRRKQVRRAVGRQPPSARIALEIDGEILVGIRLGRMDDGVIHVRARDEDPPDRVGVDREKGIPIDGEVGKRYARRVGERGVGKERLIGHVVVGFLALVISEQDASQGECSRKEHHDGHDENRGPKTEAPLPRRGNRACRSGRTHMRAPVELRFPSPSTIRGHTRLPVDSPLRSPRPAIRAFAETSL